MAKKTKSQTEAFKKEIIELKDKYLRLAAEFENYKRRTSKEKAESIQYGKESIINSILTLLDDFARAKSTNEQDIQGYILIGQKFQDILSKHDVKKLQIEPLAVFDAEKHEAISSLDVKDKKEKGKIIEEIEAGYVLGEKIIRYPKVIIGK